MDKLDPRQRRIHNFVAWIGMAVSACVLLLLAAVIVDALVNQ